MIKSYKYKLAPTRAQRQFFEQSFGCCRFVYNWQLDKKIKTYQATKTTLSAFDLMNELPQMKKSEEYGWLKDVAADQLQQSIKNMDSQFVNFFREKKGFPKFKAKHRSSNSFKIVMGFNIDFDSNQVKIPKLGWVRFWKDKRRFDGRIGTVTISKNRCNEYFVSILVDNGIDLPPRTKVVDDDRTIGIDVGIKTFQTLSNGAEFANPKHLEKMQKTLAHEQKVFQRKTKDSKRRERQRLKVAKIHNKIANQRNHFLHNVTSYLVKNYDTIIVEDLNVDGMLKNHCLAKSISSQSWSEFFRQLSYKCDWNGKNLIRIGRFEPSSKMCGKCGSINRKLMLSDRTWTCPSCGQKLDRDKNAQSNIRSFGLEKTNLIGQAEKQKDSLFIIHPQ